ncbi:MAG TPA: winged helix-turn-helix domain-containing protein [Candidatus Sulfotelmatobacter sp.]|jgi:transcriptional activator of cad operon|nr:winged helix-turn-helix domain-containing protein [Candidatus Sulfotelmatobacter sp.]
MKHPITTPLCIGDWSVNPRSCEISRNGETARAEVRTMRLLLCLAEHPGEVVSIDDLLNQVWTDVSVSQDSVYQAVTSLRRLLGDDPKQPTYIETVPRLGYRMVAKVSTYIDESVSPTNSSAVPRNSSPRRSARFTWTAGVALCLALVSLLLYRAFPFHNKFANNNLSASPIPTQPQNSIAVLPFLDLTDDMNQEPFADGMTEELIDKLSKIPGLRVPPPTSSFYYKGKLWPRSKGTPQITIPEIAKALGVAYVLDGSVRKSGSRIRIDARLVRADNGYVIWSETYDRPFDDILMVQDDIATEVTKALRASIESKPGH